MSTVTSLLTLLHKETTMQYKLIIHNQLAPISEVQVAIDAYLTVSPNHRVVLDRHCYVQLLNYDNVVVEVITLTELLSVYTDYDDRTVELLCSKQGNLNTHKTVFLQPTVKLLPHISKLVMQACTKQFGLVLEATTDISSNMTVTTESGTYLVRLNTIIGDSTDDHEVISTLINEHRMYVESQFNDFMMLLPEIVDAIDIALCKEKIKGFSRFRYVGNCNIEVITLMGRTITKLGKFTRTFSTLSDYDIRELVESQKALDSNVSRYTIKYINTAEEYVAAYRIPLHCRGNENVSCMTNSTSVRVYAHDTNLKLFLVYLEDKLVARTLVRTDINAFVKIYLDESSICQSQVNRLLQLEGFTTSYSLTGITLTKELNFEGNIVCPFIDGSTARITDCGTHLLIDINGASHYVGNSTSGVANPHNI